MQRTFTKDEVLSMLKEAAVSNVKETSKLRALYLATFFSWPKKF